MKRKVAPQAHKRLILSILAGVVLFAAGAGAGGAYVTLFGATSSRHAQAVTTPKDTPHHTTNGPQPSDEAVYTPDFSFPQAKNGLAPVIRRFDTHQPVVFLGIDDGNYKDPSVVQMMRDNHIHASLFLSKLFIANNPDFFKQLIDEGSVVENHTLSHDTNMIKTQSYEQQKQEICGMADYEQQMYNVRPQLFRPPGGAYSTVMQKAANDCGMKAIITWAAKANGGSMQYQEGNGLRPGDIVLMHFRPEFKKDMQAFIDAMHTANLHTELLEDAMVAV